MRWARQATGPVHMESNMKNQSHGRENCKSVETFPLTAASQNINVYSKMI